MGQHRQTLEKKIKEKKLFLWDFDGCFCNSERVHFLAYSKAFAQFSHTVKESEYYERFTHTGLGVKAEIEAYQLSCKEEEIRALKNKFYWEMISRGDASIFPEIPEILTLLKKMGAKIAIASNSVAEEIKNIIAQEKTPLLLDNIFGWSPELRKKPFPDIFLKACRDFAIDPKDTLVFEDSQRGIAAANAAHCDSLWMQTEFNDKFTTQETYLAKLTHQELLEILRALNAH